MLANRRSTSALPAELNIRRRANWLAEAASPIASRRASQPLETELLAFMAAASSVFGGADFAGGNSARMMLAACARACSFSSHSAARSA